MAKSYLINATKILENLIVEANIEFDFVTYSDKESDINSYQNDFRTLLSNGE